MTAITEDFDNKELTAGDPLLPSQDGLLDVPTVDTVMIKIVDDQGDTVSYFPAKEFGSIVDNAEAA